MANKLNLSRTHCLNGNELATAGMRPNGDCAECARAAVNRSYAKLSTRPKRPVGRDMVKRRIWWKDYYEKRPSRGMKDDLKKLYGMSVEKYEALLKEQHGVCAICKRAETTLLGKNKRVARLSVDHNHETQEHRGLLCNNCNRALGMLKDDIAVLYAAIRYLGKYAKNIEPLALINAKVS